MVITCCYIGGSKLVRMKELFILLFIALFSQTFLGNPDPRSLSELRNVYSQNKQFQMMIHLYENKKKHFSKEIVKESNKHLMPLVKKALDFRTSSKRMCGSLSEFLNREDCPLDSVLEEQIRKKERKAKELADIKRQKKELEQQEKIAEEVRIKKIEKERKAQQEKEQVLSERKQYVENIGFHLKGKTLTDDPVYPVNRSQDFGTCYTAAALGVGRLLKPNFSLPSPTEVALAYTQQNEPNFFKSFFKDIKFDDPEQTNKDSLSGGRICGAFNMAFNKRQSYCSEKDDFYAYKFKKMPYALKVKKNRDSTFQRYVDRHLALFQQLSEVDQNFYTLEWSDLVNELYGSIDWKTSFSGNESVLDFLIDKKNNATGYLKEIFENDQQLVLFNIPIERDLLHSPWKLLKRIYQGNCEPIRRAPISYTCKEKRLMIKGDKVTHKWIDHSGKQRIATNAVFVPSFMSSFGGVEEGKSSFVFKSNDDPYFEDESRKYAENKILALRNIVKKSYEIDNAPLSISVKAKMLADANHLPNPLDRYNFETKKFDVPLAAHAVNIIGLRRKKVFNYQFKFKSTAFNLHLPEQALMFARRGVELGIKPSIKVLELALEDEVEYLILNSWGTDCKWLKSSKQYDSSYDCHDGNIWVSEKTIVSNLNDYTVFTKKSPSNSD